MKSWIDISTEEKKQQVYNLFSSFSYKKDIFEYYGKCYNTDNLKYVNEIARIIGFDFDYYKGKRKQERKCLYCGKILNKDQKKFCCKSHSAIYNKKETPMSESTKKKISEKLKNRIKIDGIDSDFLNSLDNSQRRNVIRKMKKKCALCGESLYHNKKSCELCGKEIKTLKSLECFGLDVSSIGTPNIHDEFNKVKDLLYTEYYTNQLSSIDIKDKYGYEKTAGNLSNVMRRVFGFNLRDLSNSQLISIKNGKIPFSTGIGRPSYKSGWKTTWNGRKVFYRSSYEFEYSCYLDENEIDYEMEDLRIQYYDTVKKKIRYAIPDFHIINENKVIEVKSEYTFDKQNMIDRFSSYAENGYDAVLLYEKKEYSFEEMKNIPESKKKIKQYAE